MGKFSDANAWFEKAAKISANSAQVQMNQGLIALKEGNQEKAAQCFGNAASLEETKEATGVLYLEKGEYQKAVKAFGDNKTNNAALAQILVKDYAKANNTLDAVATPDAMTYYLKAVIGARTNNETQLAKNLRQAVNIDENLKVAASNDIEFANYDITSIIAE
jgi:tetratricopeptide (TPR) repeat protein